MRKLNAIKYWYGFMLMLATISFVACTDDNDDTESPVLEVSPTTLNFTAEGTVEEGSQAYFEITSNRSWTITIQDDKDWVTLSETEGSGNAKIEVSVPAGAVDEAKVDIQIGNKAGTLLSKTVTIRRGAGSEPVETVVIYQESLGSTAVAEKTPVANFTDWGKQGTGAANVTYTGSSEKMDVRAKSSGGYEGASGGNAFFFGTGPASLIINKIALTSEQTKLKLTFGVNSYVYDTGDKSFDESKFPVYLSADGTNWTQLTYTRNKGDEQAPNWVLATANFTLKNAVSELYIKFAPTVASLFSLDDIVLATGVGGTEIDLTGGSTGSAETTPITIPELVELAKANTSQVVVDANANRYFEAVVQADVAGGNYTQGNLPLAVEGANEMMQGITLYGDQVEPSTLGVTKGDKVKVTLYKDLAKAVNYSGLYEITGALGVTWCKVEKIGTAEITPIVLTDLSNLADYQGMTVTINNVTSPAESKTWGASGAQVFTVNGTNLNVFAKLVGDFATTVYKANTTASITGLITVYKNAVQIVPRTIEDVAAFTSNDPYISKVEPTTLTFPLTGGEQEITVTGANLEGKTLTVTGISSPVSAEVNGNIVKVKVEGATASGTQTLTIGVDGGNSQDVTINIVDESAAPTISLDFTNDEIFPTDFPSGSTNAKTTEENTPDEYTFNGYTLKIHSAGGYYKNTGYLMLKNTKCYIEFPIIDGKKLVKVVASNSRTTSTSLAMAIQDSNGATVSGGEQQTWSTQNSSYTYILAGTSVNTAYRIVQTSTKNAQISKLDLYYE